MTPEDLDRLFTVAERAYFSGLKEVNSVKITEDWKDCVAASRAYVALGGRKNVHVYLNIALNYTGMVREALESCYAGLLIDPEEVHLLANVKIYSKYLSPETGQHLN